MPENTRPRSASIELDPGVIYVAFVTALIVASVAVAGGDVGTYIYGGAMVGLGLMAGSLLSGPTSPAPAPTSDDTSEVSKTY